MNYSSDCLVSVLMSAYNHAPYVGAAIESVLGQTHQNLEFLITDDGSSDGTVEEIKKYNDSRIKFNPSAVNRGACTAINELIDNSKGNFICIMNSDDIWCDRLKIEKQLNILKYSVNVGATFGMANFIDERNEELSSDNMPNKEIFKLENQTRGQWLESLFINGNSLCHPTIMIRKECYNRLGGYKNTLRQIPDLDMWIRLLKKYDIHVASDKYISFRILPGQNASSPTRRNSIRDHNEYHLVRRHFFDNLSDQDFIEGFGKYFLNPEANDSFSITIEKALVYFNKKSRYAYSDRLIGLDLIKRLLEDPETKNILAVRYGINDKWFHEKICEFNIFIETNIIENNLDLARKKIHNMESSLCWKFTKPLRILNDLFH